MADRLSMSINPRLSSYSLSISCCRRVASRALCLTLAESWLATTAVTRNANSATQFCGSAIVKVPTGGRKKKLKHSIPATEETIASSSPHSVAMPRIANKRVSAIVVLLTSVTMRRKRNVIPETIRRLAQRRARD